MAEQVLIQFRADRTLKNEVSDIYEALGMDLPTALRVFMVKSKQQRGLPFDAVLPAEEITRVEALKAFAELRAQAADVPEMSLREIDDEISEARKDREVGKA